MRRYGVMGQRLARLSRGIDTRKVDPTSDMKSVSAETTFNEDLCDARAICGRFCGPYRRKWHGG